LSAWFDLLDESFSYKEVQFKTFRPPVTTSGLPAENVSEITVLVILKLLNKYNLSIIYLLVTMMTSSAMLANSLIAKYTILRSITYKESFSH